MRKHLTQKYFIFTKHSLNELEAAVNEAIGSGWVLLGAPFTYPVYVERSEIPNLYRFENHYAQAVILEVDKWIKQPPTPLDVGGLGVVGVDGRGEADEAGGVALTVVCNRCGMSDNLFLLQNETDDDLVEWQRCSWLSVCCRQPIALRPGS